MQPTSSVNIKCLKKNLKTSVVSIFTCTTKTSLIASDEGDFEYNVEVSIFGGNPVTSSATRVVIDKTIPTLTIVDPATKSADGTTFTFSLTPSEAIAYVIYKLDEQIISSTTAVLSYSVKITDFVAHKVEFTVVDSAGNISVPVSKTFQRPPPMPVISTQPISIMVNPGDSTTLAVIASVSSGVLSYQWFFEGKLIAGATGASYVVASAQAVNAGAYSVFVKSTLNGLSSEIESAKAQLTINPNPPIKFSLLNTDWMGINQPANRAPRLYDYQANLFNDANQKLFFDFPVMPNDSCGDSSSCNSQNYLYTKRVPLDLSRGGALTITINIVTTGNPVFQYYVEPGNPRSNIASGAFRFLIWSGNQNPNDGYRWWGATELVGLSAGRKTMSIPLDPVNWSGVMGLRGNVDIANWNNAIRNVSSIGLTFGGNYFFGHGVYVTGGTARFTIEKFEIQPTP